MFISYDPQGSKRGSKIPDSEWNRHRDFLMRLYQENDLKAVMRIMQSQHGFYATRRQYTQKFAEWRCKKNVRSEDMQLISQKYNEREAMGKLASSITYHSREVEHRKLQRFRRSHANTTKLKEVPSTNLPSHIVVTTPPRSSSPFFEAFHGNIMPRNLSFQQSPSQPFHRMKLESLIKRHQQGSDNAISSGFVPPKLYHEILNKILPSNVVSRILLCLDFEDIFHLSLTCRTARILLKDPSICKSILESKLPYSGEAREASAYGTGHASAFWRAAKRRLAFRTGNPFSAVIVGFGDSFIYRYGMLCYKLGDKIRMLDLHNSGSTELVISIPELLVLAVPLFQKQEKNCFELLHYSGNMISSLYRSALPDQELWLVVFDIRKMALVVSEPLATTRKLFVRNNKEFIYYGTQSDIETDGKTDWELRAFHVPSRKWYANRIVFADVSHSEVGSTTCFELHQGYFYAISNQTPLNFQDYSEFFQIDWSSYYHVMRVPLDSPCQELCETKKIWRRQHEEGPIDDRWTTINLENDEFSGILRIVEMRNEWFLGGSKTCRSSYMTDVYFPGPPARGDDVQNDNAFTVTAANLIHPMAPSSSMTTSSISPLTREVENSRNSRNPPSPLPRLLRKDHSGHFPPLLRSPHTVHPAFDYARQKLDKFCVRYYHSSSGTFLDMINLPAPKDKEYKQRLRLHVRNRLRSPPLVDHSGLYRSSICSLSDQLKETFREDDGYWPPEQDPDYPDKKLDSVYRLLNPPSHLGTFEGTADERSLVYSTNNSHDEPAAIIFISFDPAIRLKGAKKMCLNSLHRSNQSSRLKEDLNRMNLDGNGGATNASQQSPIGRFEIQNVCDLNSSVVSWCWKDRAMYRDIGVGYQFYC